MINQNWHCAQKNINKSNIKSKVLVKLIEWESKKYIK